MDGAAESRAEFEEAKEAAVRGDGCRVVVQAVGTASTVGKQFDGGNERLGEYEKYMNFMFYHFVLCKLSALFFILKGNEIKSNIDAKKN